MGITELCTLTMGFAVRVRSAGQKHGPTCHQRDGADVTEFVALVRLSSLGQHVGVLALAGYKRRKSALTASPILLPLQEVFGDARSWRDALLERYAVTVPVLVVHGVPYARLSCNVYNTLADYRKLLEAINALKAEANV